MRLTFLGATKTVTGSKYLLSSNSKKILIDCGLFQGLKELRLRNWSPLPISPRDIDAVILTHAHIDHTGYLPLLVKNGFSGPIYSTPATKDLCSILLPDSGHLQEEDARYANKKGFSKHKPALPLYTREDALRVLPQIQTIDYEKGGILFDELKFSFHRAGHILGSAVVVLKYQKTTLLFTGDMGRPNDPVMRPPVFIPTADYIVTESTYGNRLHEKSHPEEELADIINQTAKRGGSIIIPAFAVGRAQTLLYYIDQLKAAKKIPNLPVFLDSPMAKNATNLLHQYLSQLRLSKQKCAEVCKVPIYVNTPDESKEIDNNKVPIIIISASGMADGGRILHHLKAFAPEHRNTILFTGFQAAGTRGARMLNGEKEIKIHGQMIPIKAEVRRLDNLSAHADYQELLEWFYHFEKPPKKVFITHGEPEAATNFKAVIEEQLGWSCVLPEYLQTVSLS